MQADELARAVFEVLDEGIFQAAWRLAWVSEDDVLRDVRRSGASAGSLDDLRALPTEALDAVADQFIGRARRSAALSGASMGAAGWAGLPPGLGHLVVVIVRMAERISLLYGFDYRTDRGEIALWKALASATGAQVDWEGTEAQILRRLPAVVTGTGTFANPLLLRAIQAVLARIAIIFGLRATRWIPLVGGGSGALLNWLQVGRVGRRLKEHWRSRHVLCGFDANSAVEVEIVG